MIRAHLIHLFTKKEGVVSCGVKVNSIVECTYPKVHLFTHLILLVVFGRRKKKNEWRENIEFLFQRAVPNLMRVFSRV